MGHASPIVLDGPFWLEEWLLAYRVATWLIVGGLGLYGLGFVVLVTASVRSGE